MIVIKGIKDFLAANGASTEEVIVAACVENGTRAERAQKVIERMTTRGKLVKTDDNYDLPA